MSAFQSPEPRAVCWTERPSSQSLASTTIRHSLPLGVMLGQQPHLALSTPAPSAPASNQSMKAWQAAEIFSPERALRGSTPSVAVNAQGHAFAVWVHADGAADAVWFSRYVPEQGWEAADSIPTGMKGVAGEPQVALDEQGDALVVWTQFDGSRRALWASRLVAGLAWSAPERIGADRLTDVDSPRLAIDARGGAMVVWRQFDASVSRNIWASRCLPGEAWGAAELVGREGAGTAFDPQLALDPKGNAFVLWVLPGGRQGCVWTNRCVVGRGWETPVALDSGRSGDVVEPQLVCNGRGDALAVWCQRQGAHYAVWVCRHAPAFGWGAAMRLGLDLSSSASTPQVALNARGEAVVTWDQFGGPSRGIWVTRFAPGAGWTMAVPLTGGDDGDAHSPRVAIDARGDAVALWVQSCGVQVGICASAFSPRRGWDLPARVKRSDADSLAVPQLAMDADGHAVAVWMQSEPSGFAVVASAFR